MTFWVDEDLADALKVIKERDGIVRLLDPTKRIRDLLSITRLLDSFDSPLPDARWNAAVWVTVGVLLTLAFILITRFSGWRVCCSVAAPPRTGFRDVNAVVRPDGDGDENPGRQIRPWDQRLKET